MERRRVPEYKILQDRNEDMLASMVNEHLQLGWSLVGGLTVARATGSPLYAQAIVIDKFIDMPEE